jgi:hypothetical protein
MKPPKTIVVDDVLYCSVAAAAEVIGRSTWTIKRMEKLGLLPRPGHIVAGQRGSRWYTKADLEELARWAGQAGLFKGRPTYAQARAKAHPVTEPLKAPPPRPKTWQTIDDRKEQPSAPKPWRRLVAEAEGATAEGKPGRLPDADRCGQCGTELVWHSKSNPGVDPRFNCYGSCPTHGIVVPFQPPRQQVRWLTEGPATTVEALAEATRGWGRPPTESEHFGFRS